MAAFSNSNARVMDSRLTELETGFFGLNDPHDASASMISSPMSALDTYDDFYVQSFFPSPIDSALPPLPAWLDDRAAERGNLQPTAPNLDVHTPLPALNTRNLDNGAIGDRFYGIQQASSPSIVVTPQPPVFKSEESGQFLEKDFIEQQAPFIYLQTTDNHDVSLEIMEKVRQGYKVQHTQSIDHMDGVRAVRIGIATICQPSKNPPPEHELFEYLRQGLAAGVKEENQPRVVNGIGLDRPLAVSHLLMMLHRYGLKNNQYFNIGIIRPLSAPTDFSARTYTITLEGPKTPSAKTLWVYENANGAWSPIAPDNFIVANKTYAEAVKSKPVVVQRRRAISSVSVDNGFLHPDRYQISTSSRTVSESGSEGTTVSCKSCGKAFAHEGDLKQHSRNHRLRTHDCPICHKKFLWDKDLRRHQKTHGAREQRLDYRCRIPGCPKAYTRRDNLNRHLRLDHPGSERSFSGP